MGRVVKDAAGDAERRGLADGLEAWLGASVLGDVEPVLFFAERDA